MSIWKGSTDRDDCKRKIKHSAHKEREAATQVKGLDTRRDRKEQEGATHRLLGNTWEPEDISVHANWHPPDLPLLALSRDTHHVLFPILTPFTQPSAEGTGE